MGSVRAAARLGEGVVELEWQVATGGSRRPGEARQPAHLSVSHTLTSVTPCNTKLIMNLSVVCFAVITLIQRNGRVKMQRIAVSCMKSGSGKQTKLKSCR